MALITSNGTGGGNWSDSATWQGGLTPTRDDEVTIDSGDVVVLDDQSCQAHRLTINPTGSLENSLVSASSITLSAGLTQEEHNKLLSMPSADEIASKNWNYIL